MPGNPLPLERVLDLGPTAPAPAPAPVQAPAPVPPPVDGLSIDYANFSPRTLAALHHYYLDVAPPENYAALQPSQSTEGDGDDQAALLSQASITRSQHTS